MGIENIQLKRLIERIKELILAVLSAVLISSFIISHTKVPTASMVSTINPGDHLIVNRIPYYYRDPIRGEIVVFYFEEDHLIKRIIGVPGDEINIESGKVYVNGKVLEEAYLNDKENTYLYAGSKVKFPYIVPEGYYFMMGDNRSNSKDSRVFGPIARKEILAKAGLCIYPFNRIGILK